MTLATTTGQKRKRKDGFAMPKLRDVVDPETGEIYHVETTRQAKKRHRRNADFYNKPTIGQINAADIWNKQEEKIKKDKERAEKRKQNKLKQEKKNARQKEVQEQMLKEGKITAEDTWGKVNASQNRLHRFFGVAQKQTNEKIPGDQSESVNNTSASEDDEDDEDDTDDLTDNYTEETAEDDVQDDIEDTSNILNQPFDEQMDTETFLQSISFEGDLDAIFTNSPLSPESIKVQNQSRACFRNQPNISTHDDRDQLQPQTDELEAVRMSQIMMPPPRRPAQTKSKKRGFNMTQPSDQVLHNSANPSSKFRHQPPAATSNSHFGMEAVQQQHPVAHVSYGENNFFLGTQMVTDTLLGICSQDFKDDFGSYDNDTKSSPKIISPRPATVRVEKFWEQAVDQGRQDSSRVASDATFESVLESFDSEEFEDIDIDDETLFSLAATQQLKHELFTHSTQKKPAPSVPVFGVGNDNDRNVLRQNIKPNGRSVMGPELSDSFGASGFNDSDLLEGLYNFESENYLKGSKIPEFIPSKTTRPLKKRRILPWIKNPISPDVGCDVMTDPFPSSPLSPTVRK